MDTPELINEQACDYVQTCTGALGLSESRSGQHSRASKFPVQVK